MTPSKGWFSEPYLDFLVDEVLTLNAASRTEPRHIALVPLLPGEAYTPERRRLFQDQYHVEPLFVRVGTNPDGSPDFTTPVLAELEALAPAGSGRAPPPSGLPRARASGPGTDTGRSLPPPSRWVHETTEDPQYRGRRDALDRFHRWCADPSVRLVAVIGFGGLGKTALVGHWLKSEQGWRHRPFDGLLFWSFYNERNVTAFLATLVGFGSEALGARPPERTKLLESARSLLRSRRLLLVLDGLEVLQEVADSPQYGR